MKNLLVLRTAAAAVIVMFTVSSLIAQRPTTPRGAVKNVVFAVLNDGKMIEPIGYIEAGLLRPPVGGDQESDLIREFNTAYYKKGTVYDLIFGGKKNGTVTVQSSDHTAECSKNLAQVTVASSRTKLAGKVMSLATNRTQRKPGSGVRRLPTKEERAAAEAIVRAEMRKQGNPASLLKNLRSHNLTALDFENDGTIEMVGSYWIEPNAKTRNMLFFIAEKNDAGDYVMSYGKYNSITEENVMSGEIIALDTGVYHELLLDIMDVNGDGVSEVFTYVQSFEGAGFNAYRRVDGKWNSFHEFSNYHCGY
jgi:hypothetical protein